MAVVLAAEDLVPKGAGLKADALPTRDDRKMVENFMVDIC
jgi:hypothetical protein